MYPILNNTDLAEKNILENEVAMEHVYGNPFGDFTGESKMSVVMQVMNSQAGIGQNIIFPIADAQDPDRGVAVGDTTLRGQEEAMRRSSDKVEIDYVRFATKVPNYELGEIRSPIPIYEEARDELAVKGQERLRNDLLAAAAEGLITTNVDTKTGELVAGAASPAKQRVLFGNDEANYNATLATGIGACDTTNDKLSVSMIRKLVNKAKSMKGTYDIASRPRRLMPAMIEGDPNTMSLKQMYVLFADRRSILDLQLDEEFKALRDDARSNVIAESFIDRTLYVGKVENVLIFEMPEIERVSAGDNGASSAEVTHNFFCGAQAFGLGWGNMGEFREEDEDYGKDIGVAWHSIRGQKRLEYTPASGSPYNLGLIHAFAATSF